MEALAERYSVTQDVVKALLRVYGSFDEVEAVLDSVGKAPSRYYLRVNTLKTSPNEVVESLREKGVDVCRDERLSEALWTRILGPNELPELDKRIVVDKFCAEAVAQGASVYAPGIKMCRGLRRGDTILVVDPKGRAVAVGVAAMGEREVLERRRGLAIKTILSLYSIPSVMELEEYKLGLVYPQTLPAMVVSHVLDPQPGETILDMCASPGGKTGHIAMLMQNKGVILAVDRRRGKIEKFVENMRRLGVSIARPIVADSRYLDLEFPNLSADRVLVDPPCSAIGTRPKLFDETTYRRISALSNYQKQFLKVASKVVRRGGIVVYSTCTLTIEENEEVVRYAVEECGLELDEQPLFIGSRGLAGFDECQRFHPHVHDTPGFFIVRFRKP